MSHLSERQKQALIAAGAAKREERRLRREKERNDSLAIAKARELKDRIGAANDLLYRVIFRSEQLSMETIPQITELFKFKTDLGACVAYKMCLHEYDQLIIKCWGFRKSKYEALAHAAFEFWDEVLSFPEISPRGTIILNILAAGQINEYTFMILKKYQKKFAQDWLAIIIATQCERYLKNGGIKLPLSEKMTLWSDKQKVMLQEIVRIYQKFDTRTLEEIAEDTLD